MLHPAMVHFAVVLPIVALIIGVIYLRKPSESMSKASSLYLIFASLFMIVAFFSGKADGSEVYPFLSTEGREVLLQHKSIGMYLAIGMVLATVIKLFGTLKANKKAEVFSLILVAMLVGTTLYQGKLGGELTYEYGAHVKNHSDGMDCLDDPEEFLEEE